MSSSKYAPRRVAGNLLRDLGKRLVEAGAQQNGSTKPTMAQRVAKEVRAHATQLFLQNLMMTSLESGLAQDSGRRERIIVSLTSIPRRLYDVATTVESLMHQTEKPDAIVLWLDEQQCNDDNLPITLQRQRERGLTVVYTEDIGPHTKLVPALRAYPNDIIITVDDDVLYPHYLVERLVRAYREDASKIYCTRARSMLNWPTVGGSEHDGWSYEDDWPNIHHEAEGLRVFPLGVGGVLYPPGIFGDDEVFNLPAQRDLAPKADDIWFKAMSLRRGVACKRLDFPRAAFPLTPTSQEVDLRQYNVFEGGNQRQVQATFDRYDLWDFIREEPVP